MTLKPVDNSRPPSRKGHCGVAKGSLWSDPHRKDSRNYIDPCPSTTASTSARTRDDQLPPSLRSVAIEPEFPALQFDQQHHPKGTGVTNSALRKTGSTRQWRRLRKPYSDHLAAGGTLECAARRSPNCIGTIRRSADFALGHVIARIDGGDDRQLQPECRPCSDHQGGQLAHQPQTAPERKW